MVLTILCASLAPIGWVRPLPVYAVRVGEAARLGPRPIENTLVAQLAEVTAPPRQPYAFFSSRDAYGAGDPPPGITVEPTTGALVGTPTMAGSYTVAVGVGNGAVGAITGPAFMVRVLPPPSTTASLR